MAHALGFVRGLTTMNELEEEHDTFTKAGLAERRVDLERLARRREIPRNFAAMKRLKAKLKKEDQASQEEFWRKEQEEDEKEIRRLLANSDEWTALRTGLAIHTQFEDIKHKGFLLLSIQPSRNQAPRRKIGR